jgi:hypothetical protein
VGSRRTPPADLDMAGGLAAVALLHHGAVSDRIAGGCIRACAGMSVSPANPHSLVSARRRRHSTGCDSAA